MQHVITRREFFEQSHDTALKFQNYLLNYFVFSGVTACDQHVSAYIRNDVFLLLIKKAWPHKLKQCMSSLRDHDITIAIMQEHGVLDMPGVHWLLRKGAHVIFDS